MSSTPLKGLFNQFSAPQTVGAIKNFAGQVAPLQDLALQLSQANVGSADGHGPGTSPLGAASIFFAGGSPDSSLSGAGLVDGIGRFLAHGSEGLNNTTFSFAGPTTSSPVTITETITNGAHTSTIVYTQTQAASGSAPALYQITSGGHPDHEGYDHSSDNEHSAATTSNGPTFSFGFDNAGNVVTETINGPKTTTTLTFDATHHLTNELTVINTPSSTLPNGGTLVFNFATDANGNTSVSEKISFNGTDHTFTLPINPTAVFTSAKVGDVTTETETFVTGATLETLTYTNTTGTDYVLASINKSSISQGSATTPLDVHAELRVKISLSDSGATITPIYPNGKEGTPHAASSHDQFVDVSSQNKSSSLKTGSFVEQTSTFDSHSLNTLFYSATGSAGVYTEVAHGQNIDVTGIADQLAHLPSGVLALV